MNNLNQEYMHSKSNAVSVVVAILVGGLAGAMTMLFLAPQSGRVLRRQIKKKGVELRKRSTQLAEDAMEQMNSKSKKLTKGGRKTIKDFKKKSKEFAVEQLDHVSEVVEAGKTAVKNS